MTVAKLSYSEVPKPASPPRTAPAAASAAPASPAAGSGSAQSGKWWTKRAQAGKPADAALNVKVPFKQLRLEFDESPPEGTSVMPNEKIGGVASLPGHGDAIFWLQRSAEAADAEPTSGARKAAAPKQRGIHMDAFYFLADTSLRPSLDTLSPYVFTWLRRIGWKPDAEITASATSKKAKPVTIAFREHSLQTDVGKEGLWASLDLTKEGQSQTVWLRVLHDLPIVYVLAGYPTASSKNEKDLLKFMSSARASGVEAQPIEAKPVLEKPVLAKSVGAQH